MKYALIALIVILISCKQEKKQTTSDKQKELETGSIDSTNRYEAPEIGWTANVPAGGKSRLNKKPKQEPNAEKRKLKKQPAYK